ncbi:putative DNA binding protein [Melia azedarach]|uniref:DNA binding protein n=1 Tax=Melia azedarach TaxID=155640 RepID=A0ACC1YPY8_MELAZ|nr:putative DNA binding protein [Melia azedarach]
MSFQNKGFWMAKGTDHVTDGDAAFDNSSSIETKRSHQWFASSGESELFPNKKQAVQAANNKSSVGVSNSDVPCWGNTSSFQSVPNQFIGRLFGSESARSVNFTERNVSSVGINDIRRKGIEDHFGEHAAVGLSISHAMEDPEASCFNYGGLRKVKVNQVKDSNNGMHALKEHSFDRESNNALSPGQAYTKESQSSYMTLAQEYNKEDDSVTLMGHTYNRGDGHIRSAGNTYCKADDNALSLSETYSKEDTSIISFVGFHDEHEIIPVGQPISSYDSSYDQSSIQTSEATPENQLNVSNANAVAASPRLVKSKPETVSKNKPEFKSSKKEAPNSFPSNVRSLISTGMLDGVPVKYISLSREELRGVIKGSGYLCGCQSCNYSKVLNAYEFERHAGCKTKHPNNHIYFENGKTIYQIVQELRSTPESLLFDTIQTVFGAPINQKSFRIWKESFQAATRELQRIYGKEELNL